MEALSRSAQYIANFEPITLISALAVTTASPHLHREHELQRVVPRGAQVRLARPHQRRLRRLEPGHVRQSVEARNSAAISTSATPNATSAPTNSRKSSALWTAGMTTPSCATRRADGFSIREDAFPQSRRKTLQGEGRSTSRAPPQGRPVIVQAGTPTTAWMSPHSRGDLQRQLTIDTRQKYFKEEDARRTSPAATRPSQGDAGLSPYVWRTAEEAKEKYDYQNSLMHPIGRARSCRRCWAASTSRPNFDGPAGQSADVRRQPEHVCMSPTWRRKTI